MAFASFEFDDISDILFTTGFNNDSQYIEQSRFPESGWNFLGMIGIFDPPRPEIRDVVSRIERAGIRLFMVTGDHPTTAEALARQSGFGNGDLKSKAEQNQIKKRMKNEMAFSENGILNPNIQKQISVDLSTASSGKFL